MLNRSIGGGWSQNLLTFTRSGTERNRVPSTISNDANDGKDLLSFLAVAQKLKVDFLPLTWQPALDALGEGATAEIRQAPVRLQTKFAFKCAKVRADTDEAEYYRALTTELLILGHPLVRNHPNIVSLVGICWDVDVKRDRVLPVLVAHAAVHGDLGVFMTEGPGKDFSLSSRLDLCCDIAHAVANMHRNGIIHGDLKPANILIYATQAGFTAKLTDFGYSALYANVGDHNCLPKSSGWTGPEWHRRGFDFADAVKMDIYSFGMVCAWVLVFSHQPEAMRLILANESSPKDCVYDRMNDLKMNTSDGYDTTNIQFLFEQTLASSPFKRASTFEQILPLIFCEAGQEISQLLPASRDILPIKDEQFKTITSISQLIEAHPKVRQHLVNCLENRLLRCHDSLHEALELAFCYHIGFGARRRPNRASKILTEYEIPKTKLAEMVKTLSSSSCPDPKYQEGAFLAYLREGHIPSINITPECSDYQNLRSMESHYIAEIADLEKSLGRFHYLPQDLRVRLSVLMSDDGRWKDAKKLQLEILRIAQQTEATVGKDITSYQVLLADTYEELGRPTESEKLLSDVVEYRKAEYGPEHAYTLKAVSQLANVYSIQGQYLKAEMLGSQVLGFRKEIYGSDHQDTLNAVGGLALLSVDLGQTADTEEVLLQTVSLSRRVLGPNHRDTIASLVSLAYYYDDQLMNESAEKLWLEILKLLEGTLRPDHPIILDIKSRLANTYMELGRLDEAESLQKSTLRTSRKTLGHSHHITLSSLSCMGTLFQQKEKWLEAETTHRRVISLGSHTLGPDSKIVTLERSLLAHSLLMQGRYGETEELWQQIVESMERANGPNHRMTLDFKFNFATTLAHMGRFEDAQMLALEVLRHQSDVLKTKESDMLHGMEALITIYAHSRTQGPDERWESCSSLFGKSVTKAEMGNLLRDVLRLDPMIMPRDEEFLQAIENLALDFDFDDPDSWDIIEDVMRRILGKRQELQGSEHPHTWTSMATLATALHFQGKYAQCETLEIEVLRARETFLGGEHSDTLDSMMNLAKTYGQQEKFDKAGELAAKVVDYQTKTLGRNHPDTRQWTIWSNNWNRSDRASRRRDLK